MGGYVTNEGNRQLVPFVRFVGFGGFVCFDGGLAGAGCGVIYTNPVVIFLSQRVRRV